MNTVTLTPATIRKRRDLLIVVGRLLQPEACVQAVVGVGSIATNTARPGSDIDALVFMQPLDEYVVPAESIWCPWDDSFHSIFTDDTRVQDEGIQLDLTLCDLDQWRRDESIWTDGQRAGLSGAWIAFDRTGEVTALLAERTRYGDALRSRHLDAAVVALDQLLLHDAPRQAWESHGPLVAFDRLDAAVDALLQALFALNGRWLPWRERRMTHVLRLPWLPGGFEERALAALNAPTPDRDGFLARAGTLNALFVEVLAELQREGVYGADPIGEAFVRSHEDDPGRTWNMSAWTDLRKARLGISSIDSARTDRSPGQRG
jgi:hypothetical protein